MAGPPVDFASRLVIANYEYETANARSCDVQDTSKQRAIRQAEHVTPTFGSSRTIFVSNMEHRRLSSSLVGHPHNHVPRMEGINTSIQVQLPYDTLPTV